MGLKLSLRGSLLRCGRCGQRYSNPLSHTCVVRRPGGRVSIAPTARLTLGRCGTCGKPVTNPLTHACAGGGDFAARRREKARAEKAAKRKAGSAARREREKARLAEARTAERRKADQRVAKAKAGRRKARPGKPGQGHDYARCRDADCARTACRAYAEGLAEGLEIGRAEGAELAQLATRE